MTAPTPAAVERATLAAWRERERSFPRFVQHDPDEIDRSTGAWQLMLRQTAAALAAYHAQLDAEGMVIVPRHPTTAMQGAAAALPSCKTCDGFGDDIHQNDIWRTMADAY